MPPPLVSLHSPFHRAAVLCANTAQKSIVLLTTRWRSPGGIGSIQLISIDPLPPPNQAFNELELSEKLEKKPLLAIHLRD